MAMLSVVSLLVVLALSMLVVRVGAVSLRLTGMSDASARSQARSAFTGCGFTTSEAEQVVSHPMRRPGPVRKRTLMADPAEDPS